jgi:hypothetical protein
MVEVMVTVGSWVVGRLKCGRSAEKRKHTRCVEGRRTQKHTRSGCVSAFRRASKTKTHPQWVCFRVQGMKRTPKMKTHYGCVFILGVCSHSAKDFY